jgi:hypothetical protein
VTVLASRLTVLTAVLTTAATANYIANSLVGVLGKRYTYIINSTDALLHNAPRATENTITYIASSREEVVERRVYAAKKTLSTGTTTRLTSHFYIFLINIIWLKEIF